MNWKKVNDLYFSFGWISNEDNSLNIPRNSFRMWFILYLIALVMRCYSSCFSPARLLSCYPKYVGSQNNFFLCYKISLSHLLRIKWLIERRKLINENDWLFLHRHHRLLRSCYLHNLVIRKCTIRSTGYSQWSSHLKLFQRSFWSGSSRARRFTS